METKQIVRIPPVSIEGDLVVPKNASAAILFAHSSGSSRFSKRNRFVAAELNDAGFATLLLDLLTPEEDEHVENRFDIELLAERLVEATEWLHRSGSARHLPVGYFGASTGAAAALVAAASREDIFAVVSRGGRPDLAGKALPDVHAPVLLIVGGADTDVLTLNRMAERRLRSEVELQVVPGATHLFGEEGALEEVTRLAREWFDKHLPRSVAAAH